MYVFNLNQVIFSISVRRTMLVEMRRRYLIEAFNVKMKKKVQWYCFFFYKLHQKWSEFTIGQDNIGFPRLETKLCVSNCEYYKLDVICMCTVFCVFSAIVTLFSSKIIDLNHQGYVHDHFCIEHSVADIWFQ